MNSRSKHWVTQVAVLGVLAFVYFVLNPHDLAAILVPVEKVLVLTNAVSPWFYGVIVVAILAWTVLKIWGGGRTASAVSGDVPPT